MPNALNVRSLVSPITENTYLVWNSAKDCVVIDPGCDVNELMALVQREGLKVGAILVTHGHLDHVISSAELRRQTGAPVSIHDADVPMLESAELCGAKRHGINYEEHSPDSTFRDSDRVGSGTLDFQVIFAPGHTPGHCLLWNEEAGCVFSGDIVFQDAVGRWDLDGGDKDLLFRSIREKFLALPDETIVYSGHGPQTTVGRERTMNPFLRDGATGNF